MHILDEEWTNAWMQVWKFRIINTDQKTRQNHSKTNLSEIYSQLWNIGSSGDAAISNICKLKKLAVNDILSKRS